jgi:hypothetical protein
MRTELKKLQYIRQTFIATFERYGIKAAYKGYPITTLLFKDVTDIEGKPVTDHVWFTTSKEFGKYTFSKGNKIKFDARVKTYQKGYKGHRIDVYANVETDFKLSYATKVIRLESGQ